MNPSARRWIALIALITVAAFAVPILLMRGVAAGGTEREPPATPPKAVPSKQSASPRQSQPTHKVIAYYFHGKRRCVSCLKIEKYSQEAITGGFPEALKDGHLEWKVVDVDEPGNKHFLKEYSLFTKSLVLVDLHKGEQTRWVNLNRVWELLGNREGFIRYVRDGVHAYLRESE